MLPSRRMPFDHFSFRRHFALLVKTTILVLQRWKKARVRTQVQKFLKHKADSKKQGPDYFPLYVKYKPI